jgi:hypothetical protein
MKTTYAILKKARTVIQNPDNWCKGTRYKTVNGQAQYCLLGAVDIATERLAKKGIVKIGDADKAESWLHDFSKKKNKMSTTTYNDASTRTHNEVMSFLNKAVRAAR